MIIGAWLKFKTHKMFPVLYLFFFFFSFLWNEPLKDDGTLINDSLRLNYVADITQERFDSDVTSDLWVHLRVTQNKFQR